MSAGASPPQRIWKKSGNLANQIPTLKLAWQLNLSFTNNNTCFISRSIPPALPIRRQEVRVEGVHLLHRGIVGRDFQPGGLGDLAQQVLGKDAAPVGVLMVVRVAT